MCEFISKRQIHMPTHFLFNDKPLTNTVAKMRAYIFVVEGVCITTLAMSDET